MEIGGVKSIIQNEKALKRLAMHFVGQLPDDEEHARRVMRYMNDFYENFIVEKRKSLSIVSINPDVCASSHKTLEAKLAHVTPLKICGAG